MKKTKFFTFLLYIFVFMLIIFSGCDFLDRFTHNPDDDSLSFDPDNGCYYIECVVIMEEGSNKDSSDISSSLKTYYNERGFEKAIVEQNWTSNELTIKVMVSNEYDYDCFINTTFYLTHSSKMIFVKGDGSNYSEENTTDIILTDSDVKTAYVTYREGEYLLALQFNEEGTEKFAAATAELALSNGQIAIIVDGQVVSAPVVNEAIPGGRAVVSGNFTYEDVHRLATKIWVGSLDAKFTIKAYGEIVK